jgi:HlyD family secretion protein
VWVTNQDIGFVRQGQPVKLKLAAFPFQKYGMVEGSVEHVSADAADNNTQGQQNGSGANGDKTGKAAPLAYRALVTLKSMQIGQGGERLPLTAGMQASAEILLGRRSVMEYLLSPVQQAWHEAGRER